MILLVWGEGESAGVGGDVGGGLQFIFLRAVGGLLLQAVGTQAALWIEAVFVHDAFAGRAFFPATGAAALVGDFVPFQATAAAGIAAQVTAAHALLAHVRAAAIAGREVVAVRGVTPAKAR